MWTPGGTNTCSHGAVHGSTCETRGGPCCSAEGAFGHAGQASEVQVSSTVEALSHVWGVLVDESFCAEVGSMTYFLGSLGWGCCQLPK